MSSDVQSHLKSHLPARVAEIQPDQTTAFDQLESVLLVLASGLAAVLISTLWVTLSLG